MRAKKKAAGIPLPREEWDFTSVTPDALADAIRWEYARESKRLKDRIRAWYETELEGKPVREWLRAGVRDWLRAGSRTPAMVPRQVEENIDISGLAACHDTWLFGLIIKSYGAFPSAWSASPHGVMEHSSIEVQPLAEVIDEARKHEDPCQWLKLCSDFDFALRVDWKAPNLEDVVKSFERWLRQEAKKHPEHPKASRWSAPPAHLLKSLAALRLQKHGMTHDEVQAALKEYAKGFGEGKGKDGFKRSLLPLFDYASSRSDAIGRARALVAKVESRFPG